MFLSSLLCQFSGQNSKQALEAYKKVPKQELQTYFAYKNQIRYKSTLQNVKSIWSMEREFSKFQNNKPEEVLKATSQNLKSVMKQKNDLVVKKVIKSNYDYLVEQYKNKTSKFTDPDFRPCPQSIGKGFVRQNFQWKRLSQIIPDAKFVSDNIAPEDILQGGLGDCYFASAIAALAEHDFRIKNIFPNLEINKNGIYMARILHFGLYRQVVVDDFIPVDQDGSPVFARPAGGKQIWVMILEKCWAKLFGSYEAIAGGYPDEVLHAFSWAPVSYHSLKACKQEQQQLFNLMVEAANEGSILCSGTISDESIHLKGLEKSHAYTILDVFEKPYKMMKIRNPWGSFEWNGRASESDKKFWNQINPLDINKLGKTFGDDGTFFMLWEDFVKYFKMINICRINDNANYYAKQIEYKNDQPIMWEFETSGGDVAVTISQQNSRGLDCRQSKKGYGNVVLIVAKMNGQGKNAQFKYIDSNSSYNFADFPVNLKKLQKGKYLIYSTVRWTRSQKDLGTISLYTESKITFQQRPQFDVQDFLRKTYLDEAQHNQENYQEVPQDPKQWISYGVLWNKCHFGYVVCHVDKNSVNKIQIEICEKDYESNGMELLSPYKGKGSLKLICEPGESLIVLYKEYAGYGGIATMPEPSISFLKLLD